MLNLGRACFYFKLWRLLPGLKLEAIFASHYKLEGEDVKQLLGIQA